MTKPSEIVQLLLNDEQLATFSSSASQVPDGRSATTNGAEKKSAQDFWDDEEDNFFGHSTLSASAPDADDQGTPVHTSARGKKRKPGASGAPRGRRSGIGGRKKMTPVVASAADAS